MATGGERTQQLQHRMKRFVLDTVHFCGVLPNTFACKTFGNQLIRSSSSVSANYRAACRAKSDPDFINKMKIVEEEADESIHWFELLMELPDVDRDKAAMLAREAAEFLAITVASIKTVRSRMNRK